MTKETAIKLFNEKQIRTEWNEEEKWYFSIVDLIAVLTEQVTFQSARNYWKVLKKQVDKSWP